MPKIVVRSLGALQRWQLSAQATQFKILSTCYQPLHRTRLLLSSTKASVTNILNSELLSMAFLIIRVIPAIVLALLYMLSVDLAEYLVGHLDNFLSSCLGFLSQRSTKSSKWLTFLLSRLLIKTSNLSKDNYPNYLE